MKLKIAFIASLPESLINFRLHLIKEFLQRNFNVIVMAPPHELVKTELCALGVKYISISMERNGRNPLYDLFLLGELYFHLRKEKPQYIFSYTIKPVIYGSLAAKLAAIPNIFSMLTGTGYIFSNNNLPSRITGWIARRLLYFSLRFNSKLFFQNKDNLATFINYRLISPKHPVFIVNGSGVDIQHFKPSQLPNELSFLMIARLLLDKGINEYIEAARIIKNKYPTVKFKLVGWIDTNPLSISSEKLNEWTHSGVIDYLGKLSDVRTAIQTSSVYVLPSYGEGTPRTVLEAMAMARPIITTDVPGCRETVIPGKNGLLIEARNIKALYEAMEYFIQYPHEIEKMGKISRSIAEEKYDVNKVNQSLLNEIIPHHTKILMQSSTTC